MLISLRVQVTSQKTEILQTRNARKGKKTDNNRDFNSAHLISYSSNVALKRTLNNITL